VTLENNHGTTRSRVVNSQLFTSWQHTVFAWLEDTSVSRKKHEIEAQNTHQLPLLTPTTLMGEQVSPTRTLTS
jgi:hypothetical protein